ncbi:WecB/TagA/CpsF family glycosyltransferase [Thalassotalea castellviae]|uniref:WecB/TagA/CpsF family glycosyltransferase n=1 Tax=Thalassotalea castellviae TaxID=3075612 RepID=A0ABU2ZXZ6_9GAMM|nr:WecB/TagA/CpsF family glycosyltransferase [Thalassotalea sp. W431]MDT0602801.1 WecB/TagA/CpsF family glycosyltransferase [Thalassotalea sp. W431]
MKHNIMKKLDDKISTSVDFSLILSSIEDEKQTLVSFVNPFSYSVLLKSPEIIDGIDYFYSDGSLLQRLHNIFHPKSKVARVSFDYSSIAGEVFEYAQKASAKIALVGGTASEILKAKENIESSYPALDITYVRSGYFDNQQDKNEAFKLIEKSNADILIVGMGTPIQDQFIIDAKDNCPNVKLMFTCGGFLTQTSIKTDYYHPLIKKSGLRWLQRMVMHKHVRQRVIKDYPKFLISYLYEHIAMLTFRKS